MEEVDMLAILGAGATKSLDANKGLRFLNSSEEMVSSPTGTELIDRIINHKYKAIAGIMALLCSKLFLPEKGWQEKEELISLEKKAGLLKPEFQEKEMLDQRLERLYIVISTNLRQNENNYKNYQENLRNRFDSKNLRNISHINNMLQYFYTSTNYNENISQLKNLVSLAVFTFLDNQNNNFYYQIIQEFISNTIFYHPNYSLFQVVTDPNRLHGKGIDSSQSAFKDINEQIALYENHVKKAFDFFDEDNKEKHITNLITHLPKLLDIIKTWKNKIESLINSSKEIPFEGNPYTLENLENDLNRCRANIFTTQENKEGLMERIKQFLVKLEDIILRLISNPSKLIKYLEKVINILTEEGFLKSGNLNDLPLIKQSKGNEGNESLKFIKEALKYLCLTNHTSITPINETEHQTLEHLFNIIRATSIVEHYRPYSIDYFMLYLTEHAPYEFYDIKDNEEEKQKRKIKIEKYIKFVIANELSWVESSASYMSGENHDNYIRRLIWKVTEKSHLARKTLECFLQKNVNIISFNYETAFNKYLYNILDNELVNKISTQNITYMYGHIRIEVQEEGKINRIIKFNQDAIFKSLFCPVIGEDAVWIDNGTTSNDYQETQYRKCNDILDQIDNCIKWIGGESEENKKDEERKKIREIFKSAKEVYFLGFGFDYNNLYQLGILNRNYNLEEEIQEGKGKIIFISGGNLQIIQKIKLKFEAKEISKLEMSSEVKQEIEIKRKTKNNVLPHTINFKSYKNDYLYTLEGKGYTFIISTKFLPEAFNDF